MASISKDSLPEAAVVGIAVMKDLKIIFDTVSTSRKYQNLIKNPSIALVIGWDSTQTVQYEGVARVPEANEEDEMLEVYFSIFPDGRERMKTWKDIVYFCVKPKWIRFSDFTEPKKIEELSF